MTNNQKVSDDQFQEYLQREGLNLTIQEKYAFFQKLEKPINYALSRVLAKFHVLPLEREDFRTIAWLAFEEVLKKYQPNLAHKSFVTYVIDNVYWKAMDYACKFVNNKHKILNLSHPQLWWQEKEIQHEALNPEWSAKFIVDDYFENPSQDPQTKAIFMDYLYGLSLVAIRQKYQISRHKLKQILEKTLSDLGRLMN